MIHPFNCVKEGKIFLTTFDNCPNKYYTYTLRDILTFAIYYQQKGGTGEKLREIQKISIDPPFSR